MTPEQRKQLRQNMHAFRQMSPEQRAKLKQAWQHFQALPPEQRRALREKWRNATPEQRRQWLRNGGPESKQPPGR